MVDTKPSEPLFSDTERQVSMNVLQCLKTGVYRSKIRYKKQDRLAQMMGIFYCE